MNKQQKGFSLIELLVVIAITAVLLAVALPNYLGARERARDSKKKAEMAQFKNALRMYYNDFQQYPASSLNGNTLNACGSDGAIQCTNNLCSGIQYAAGGVDGCQAVYMKKLPDFDTVNNRFFTLRYYGTVGGDDFCLKTDLDNAADSDIVTSKARCATACGNNCNSAITTPSYCVCAD